MTVTDVTSLGAALAAQYTLERELGRGGMATVYLARDRRHDRLVALKVLHPELGATLGPERFQREIRLAARLTHPHILPVLDSGEAAGRLWYAMPYVDGETLRARLGREAQLGVAEAVAIATQVAAALGYAHGQGVVHRDIKPENILLGGGQALVADFGIAKLLDASTTEKLTETGLSLGTPAYMSPEQGSGGAVDARSDVYALGCVVYEMLAGAPPFTGPTAQAILARHAVDPVPPLRTVRAIIPAAVEDAVERALAKVPADRFATAEEFAEALAAEHRPTPTYPRLPARLVKLGLGLLVGAVAAGGATRMLRRTAAPAVVPSAATIAVLPFGSTGADTALIQLGRDLAVTISASLDRVGGIQTADRLMVANATLNQQATSPAEDAALARRLGGGSFLRGTLVRMGRNIRLDAGLYGSEGLTPLAEGITVVAHGDSIGTLTDSVAWALLRRVWQRGEPPSPSLAAVTTRSIPALRAFLEGEQALGNNQWDEAALGYRSAIASDSGFWLAHFRYALTQVWTLQPVEPGVVEALRLHRESFPERERLLVASLLDSMPPGVRFDQLRAVTQRFPEYWPGWFMYADLLYHWGLSAGHDWSEVLDAFRRVVRLNPRAVPIWVHMFELTGRMDPAESSRSLARLAELGWTPSENRLIPLIAGVSQANGVIPPDLKGMADSLAELMASSPARFSVETNGATPGLPLLRWGFPAAQLQLNHLALNSDSLVSPRLRTALQTANAWAWAARGRWDSALTILTAVAEERPGVIGPSRLSPPVFAPVGGPVLAIESYGLAVLGAWIGATAPALADQRRAAAAAAIEPLDDEESRRDARARVAWLDGLLAFTRKDRRAIQTARREAALSGYYQAQLVDRSLAAFDHALGGDRKRAGRELAELEEYCINQDYCNNYTPHIAVQRLAAAQWLQEAGDLERAVRLLRWQDAVNWPIWGGWHWMVNDALLGPAYLVRARLEEARGHPALAQQFYRMFLRRYDEPMPSQVHLVEEARAALARLGQER